MSRALDLTNQKFGKLTALERAPKQGDKYTRWKCICDCGNYATVRTDYLRNGHTSSCGCEKNKFFKKYDLVGQRFGKLTVLDREPPESQLCQCDCGTILAVLTYNLMNGNTQSCGCLQKERASEATLISLVGNKYGKLTVLERVENNRFGHVCYKCKCECGGETIVDAANLRNGNTNSCGCIKSKGEMLINNWLIEHNIEFKSQYSFEHCFLSSGRRPFFDFAIMKNGKVNKIIEFNGRQHYEATGGWNTEEELEKTKQRDLEKAQWCQQNNIPFIVIKYTDIDKLDKILQEITEE